MQDDSNISEFKANDQTIIENKELNFYEALIPVVILMAMLAYNIFLVEDQEWFGTYTNQIILLLGGAVAGVASIVPASGGGMRSWPALAAATAAGFIGSEALSNIIKNVESTRKRLAVGGAEGSIFPQGPGANRVG